MEWIENYCEVKSMPIRNLRRPGDSESEGYELGNTGVKKGKAVNMALTICTLITGWEAAEWGFFIHRLALGPPYSGT